MSVRDLQVAVGMAAVLLAACENPEPPGFCGAIPEQTIVVGETATVSACFEDPNGDVLSYHVTTSDAGVAIVSISGTTVTVTGVTPGTSVVTVTATDVTELTGDQQFRVVVPNRAPVAIGDISARDLPAGESGSVDVSANFREPDGQPLTYAMAVSDESVLDISATGSVVTFEARAKGTATVTATATDPGGLSAVQSFVVTVPNRTPGAVGTMPAQTVEVDAAATTDVTGFFLDPDGDDLAYTATSSAAAVVAVSISGGNLTVTAIAKGEATVTVTATDTEGLTATQSFVVTVPNRPPLATGSIDGRTIEVGEDAVLELSGYFEDPDGDVLVYSATTSDAAVAGGGVDGGVLTVTAVAKGAAMVTVTATDTEGLTATQEFAVTVPNRPPLMAGSIEGQTIEVGEAATVDLSDYFGDPDGDVLAYTAAPSDAAVAGAAIDGAAMTVTAVAKGEATVTVTATDTEGLAATQEFVVTVPNRTPGAVGTMPAQTVEVDAAATTDVTGFFRDPDGDDLAYTATSSAAAVVAVSISGGNLTVTAIAKGEATVTVTATDTEGLTATQSFVVTVPNRPPLTTGSIDGRTIEVGEDAVLELSGYFEDPDGDVLVYSATTSDAAVAGGGVDGGVLTVTAVAKGAAMVTVTATDTEGLTATQEFAVTVPNRPPLMAGSIEGQTIEVGEAATVDLSDYFGDPDGDVLAYTAAPSDAAVAGAAIDGAAMTVTAVAKGEATVTVTATDTEGLAATQEFVVTVPNRTPGAVGSIEERTLEMGETATQEMSGYFEDPDGDDLAYSVSSSDATRIGASIEGDAVTVEALAKGRATVTVTATDTDGLPATQEFAVTVPNRPPLTTGSIPARILEVGETRIVELAGHFSDPDGDPLVYAVTVSDTTVLGVSVAAAAAMLTANARGETPVTVTATDPEGLTATQEFVVTVPNRPPLPTGSITERTLEADETATLDLSGYFDDPDGDPLVHAATVSDSSVLGVSVSGAAVTLTANAKGETTVTVTATDPEGLAATQVFAVTVPNRPPLTIGSIAALEVGETATLDLSGYFADPDGDALTYWATGSDTTVLEVSGSGAAVTVTAIAKGEATVTVTATDPEGLEVTQEFAVTVPNRPPLPAGSIAGQTLEVGGTNTLELSGYFSDPDGDALVYVAAPSDTTVLGVSVSGDAMTVAAIAKGTVTVTVTATDPEGLAATQETAVTVPNRAPRAIGTFPMLRFTAGGVSRVDPVSRFADPDMDSLLFEAASSNPRVAKVWVSGGDVLVRGVSKGTATVTISARDPEGMTAALQFAVEIKQPGGTDPNQAPVVVAAVPALTLEEGNSGTLNTSSHFSDPDGDQLSFSAQSSSTSVATANVSGTLVELRGVGEGSATVAITASDPDGLSAQLEFRVTVSSSETPNRPPAAVGTIATQDLRESDSRTLNAASFFTDPDNDPLTFSAQSSSTEVATANVSGTQVELGAVAEGTATVTLTARDPDGLTATHSFGVTVSPAGEANRAPVAVGNISPRTLAEGDSETLDASSYFTDPDNDDLAFSAQSSSTGVATAAVSGSQIELDAIAHGNATVTLTAEDPDGLTATLLFSVTVEAPNRPPTVVDTIPAQTITTGGSETLDASSHFGDPDNDDLTFSAQSSNTNKVTVSVSGSQVVVEGVARGTSTVTITAADPAGLSASTEFGVTVTKVNQPPVVSSPYDDIKMVVGHTSLYQPWRQFHDPDHKYAKLTITAVSSDTDVVQLSLSGILTLISLNSVGEGEATVTVTARDPGDLAAQQSFQVSVGNTAPYVKYEIDDIISAPEQVDSIYLLINGVLFQDDDHGDAFTYTAESSDTSIVGTSIRQYNRQTFYLLVEGRSVGEATVTAIATDLGGLTARAPFTVTVDSNRAPRIKEEIPEQELPSNDTLVLILSEYFEDPDDDLLVYTASAGWWLGTSVSADTLRVFPWGTSTYGYVDLTATDPKGRTVEQDFYVREPNSPSGSSYSAAAAGPTGQPHWMMVRPWAAPEYFVARKRVLEMSLPEP